MWKNKKLDKQYGKAKRLEFSIGKQRKLTNILREKET